MTLNLMSKTVYKREQPQKKFTYIEIDDYDKNTNENFDDATLLMAKDMNNIKQEDLQVLQKLINKMKEK